MKKPASIYERNACVTVVPTFDGRYVYGLPGGRTTTDRAEAKRVAESMSKIIGFKFPARAKKSTTVRALAIVKKNKNDNQMLGFGDEEWHEQQDAIIETLEEMAK